MNPQYLLDFDFGNIKKFQYKEEPLNSGNENMSNKIKDTEDRPIKLSLMLHMTTPCATRRKMQMKNHMIKQVLCRSPLNISDKNTFVNYWNLNQTILLEGWSTPK